jgi:hypothetical protein
VVDLTAKAALRLRVSEGNPDFLKETGFTYDVWMTEVYQPLSDALTSETSSFNTQLSIKDRIFRWSKWFRGSTVLDLAKLTNQSDDTVRKDVRYISKVFAGICAPEVIRPIPLGGEEYKCLKGKLNFASFEEALYAIDVVDIKIPYPEEGQELYWDGKHRQHSIAYLVLIDSYGVARFVMGPALGCMNDQVIWERCEFKSQLSKYLGASDRILADGIFRPKDKTVFITPLMAYLPPAAKQVLRASDLHAVTKQMDLTQSRCRVLIENYFGRLKTNFPRFDPYKMGRKHVDRYFRTACALTNIRNTYIECLRKV